MKFYSLILNKIFSLLLKYIKCDLNLKLSNIKMTNLIKIRFIKKYKVGIFTT
jgi:hypothetical protein